MNLPDKDREKLLVLSQGSKVDPNFNEIELGMGQTIKKFMKNHGIKTMPETLIISCHGNTELDLHYAKEVQELANKGHKVVAMQQGGLYFAKPSLEAANMPTVPVISIPLKGGIGGGIDAFMAYSVPSGVATIGGVGINNYHAASIAARQILTNDYEGVFVNRPSIQLEQKLNELGINIIEDINNLLPVSAYLGTLEAEKDNKLLVSEIDFRSDGHHIMSRHEEKAGLCLYSPNKECFADPAMIPVLMNATSRLESSLLVRGDDNLAIYAAKIMSSNNPKIADKLFEMQEKKAASYNEINNNVRINHVLFE